VNPILIKKKRVSAFFPQTFERQNHAILTYNKCDIRTICGSPVSFLESHLIESKLARVTTWESFRRDPFHVSSPRLAWTDYWAQTVLTCRIVNQICLPIEYSYRTLSIFPTGSRRNQAGTRHHQHTRFRLRGHDSQIGFAKCCHFWLSYFISLSRSLFTERTNMGAPITGCSQMIFDPRCPSITPPILGSHHRYSAIPCNHRPQC